MEHELKIWPEFFDAVERGDKTAEIRVNNRPFAVGDRLILSEWRPDTMQYTGRALTRRISYVLPLDEPYVMLCIKEIEWITDGSDDVQT